eukprot:scaffold516_cov175-Amphora_coffeaeformis.AAC.12
MMGKEVILVKVEVEALHVVPQMYVVQPNRNYSSPSFVDPAIVRLHFNNRLSLTSQINDDDDDDEDELENRRTQNSDSHMQPETARS